MEEGRIFQGFQGVPARVGGEGVQHRDAGEERLFDLLAFGVVEGAVVDEDRRDVAFEGTLGVREFAGVVGIDAPSDDHLVQADLGSGAGAAAEPEAVQEHLVPVAGNLGAESEDMESAEGQAGRQVFARLQEVMKSGASR